MASRVLAGIVGGLTAGVVFGIMMQMMVAPTPDGAGMPMMSMIAMILGSTSVAIGWLYHLFNSALIGAIFAWMLGPRILSYGSGLGWGAVYGFAWWILGGLILMPVLLGMSPFAPLMMAPMRGVAVGSLIGHLVYGLILGGLYVRIAGFAPRRVAA